MHFETFVLGTYLDLELYEVFVYYQFAPFLAVNMYWPGCPPLCNGPVPTSLACVTPTNCQRLLGPHVASVCASALLGLISVGWQEGVAPGATFLRWQSKGYGGGGVEGYHLQ